MFVVVAELREFDESIDTLETQLSDVSSSLLALHQFAMDTFSEYQRRFETMHSIHQQLRSLREPRHTKEIYLPPWGNTLQQHQHFFSFDETPRQIQRNLLIDIMPFHRSFPSAPERLLCK
jgi:hypothetical protein